MLEVFHTLNMVFHRKKPLVTGFFRFFRRFYTLFHKHIHIFCNWKQLLDLGGIYPFARALRDHAARAPDKYS